MDDPIYVNTLDDAYQHIPQATLVPDIVPVGQETTVYIIFHECPNIDPEELRVTIENVGEYDDNVVLCQVNPYTFTFKVKQLFESTVNVRLVLNSFFIQNLQLSFKSNGLGFDSEGMIHAMQPLTFMLDLLLEKTNLKSVEKDRLLSQAVKNKDQIRKKDLKSLFSIYSDFKERVNDQVDIHVPTILHVVAKHNMKELCRSLTNCQGFCNAGCIRDNLDQAPKDIAYKKGNEKLAESLGDYVAMSQREDDLQKDLYQQIYSVINPEDLREDEPEIYECALNIVTQGLDRSDNDNDEIPTIYEDLVELDDQKIAKLKLAAKQFELTARLRNEELSDEESIQIQIDFLREMGRDEEAESFEQNWKELLDNRQKLMQHDLYSADRKTNRNRFFRGIKSKKFPNLIHNKNNPPKIPSRPHLPEVTSPLQPDQRKNDDSDSGTGHSARSSTGSENENVKYNTSRTMNDKERQEIENLPKPPPPPPPVPARFKVKDPGSQNRYAPILTKPQPKVIKPSKKDKVKKPLRRNKKKEAKDIEERKTVILEETPDKAPPLPKKPFLR